jgi:hypothetical protein
VLTGSRGGAHPGCLALALTLAVSCTGEVDDLVLAFVVDDQELAIQLDELAEGFGVEGVVSLNHLNEMNEVAAKGLMRKPESGHESVVRAGRSGRPSVSGTLPNGPENPVQGSLANSTLTSSAGPACAVTRKKLLA